MIVRGQIDPLRYSGGRAIVRSRRRTNPLARYPRFALGEVVELLSLRLIIKANAVVVALKIDTRQLRWGLDHNDGMLAGDRASDGGPGS